jgi:signal transduction histidine kinase
VLPAFVPVAATILVFAHLTTATLLYTLFSVLGSRSLLALASGYLLTALLLGAWGLTFPHAFAPTGVLGAGLQTTGYLYIFSRLVFPVAAIAYGVLKSVDRQALRLTNRDAILLSLATTIIFAAALVWLATAGSFALPPLMIDTIRGNHIAGPFFGIAVIALLLFAMAFVWRRNMSVLDLWLLLTLWNWLVELIVLRMTTNRFSFNWYAGVIFELVSTTFILAGLLSQTLALYARLTLAAVVQRRERESRHLALNAALAAVAHETYQPITAIAANSSAALRRLDRGMPDLDEFRAILKDILADTRRTGDAIDAIRAIFKVDSSQLAPLKIENLVQEVLSEVRAELRAHNVTADAAFETNLPHVAGDKEQLQQVLLNLIANAIEAMDEVTTRPRELRVGAVRDGNAVLVTLEDSGPGLDPVHVARIFDPFVTTKPKGSGLGLAICRSIIEAHAGRMRAAPAVPHGAVFAFTLPVAG